MIKKCWRDTSNSTSKNWTLCISLLAQSCNQVMICKQCNKTRGRCAAQRGCQHSRINLIQSRHNQPNSCLDWLTYLTGVGITLWYWESTIKNLWCFPTKWMFLGMSFHKVAHIESESMIRTTPNYTDHSLSVGRSVGSGRPQTNGIYASIEQAARGTDGRRISLQCNDHGVNNSWHCFRHGTAAMGAFNCKLAATCNPADPCFLDCWPGYHVISKDSKETPDEVEA